ncbi:MAG: type IV pilus twitching motility protein PilT [bacterium]
MDHDCANGAAESTGDRAMLIHDVMDLAIERGASDIHLTVGTPPVLRIDGDLRAVEMEPLEAEDTRELIKTITPDSHLQRLEERGGSDFGYDYREGYRFRVAIFRQEQQSGMVLRLVPDDMYSFEDLGLPHQMKDLCENPKGLMLVTGPTGSGKSTTLSTFMNYINTNFRYHIVTIEDPIEFKYDHKQSIINQRELGVDVLSFADGLRSGLRMDPDVILVGEMRDKETIRATITAAETGHLVFSTLHTNSAAQTINRIIDTFPKEEQNQVRAQLSMTLSAVISQSLLQKQNEEGRVAAFEIMINTPGIQNMIREQKEQNIPSAIQTGGKKGMQTMDDHLLELYKKGVISRESAMARAQDPDTLRKKI